MIPPKKNIQLVRKLARYGVVCSICSKNDLEVCKKQLCSDRFENIWEYFVFPSIDWTNKGERTKNLISTMGLRPANVLFLDDEAKNLQEVQYLLPDMMVATMSDDVGEVIQSFLQTKQIDETCARLKRYKELENRERNRKEYASNVEFLMMSDITVDVVEDCSPERERICELINRTNQLNFTKLRQDLSEVDALLNDKEICSGYVRCKDRWSDYGIVGFYALEKSSKELKHFLFSCRTIGMGVEQYVYCQLGFPNLTVHGDVISQVNKTDCPWWINQKKKTNVSAAPVKQSCKKNRILLKGPCDVQQVVPYFSTASVEFTEEFSYVSSSKKIYLEANNHTISILQSLSLTAEEKEDLVNTLPFIDETFYQTSLIWGGGKIMMR